MPLTDQAIKKAKAGPRPNTMSDSHGLYLMVTEACSKLWGWKYRIDGKEKVIPLGAYDDVSLALARELLAAPLKNLVGVRGFEPPVSSSRTKRLTGLGHTPIV